MASQLKRTFAEIDDDNQFHRNASPLEVSQGWPYEQNTSLVLVGIRGSGKSSLAFLAASAYSKRLVDLERAFFEHTGRSLGEHRKTVSTEEHYKVHHEVLKSVLERNASDSVIVCSFSDLEHGGRRLLRDFGKRHPVIHVTRDLMGIQSHMRLWSLEQTSRFIAISGPLLRSCSNAEFFNKTEAGPSMTPTETDLIAEGMNIDPGEKTPTPFLTLKRVERDFLKFLRQLLGDISRIPSHQSAYPLSQIPVENRRYTYATALEARQVLSGALDIEGLQVGADALQIVFDMTIDAKLFDPQTVGEIFSTVRRATILPLILDVVPSTRKPDPETRRQYLSHLATCLRLAPEYIILYADMFEPDPWNGPWHDLTWSGDTTAIGRYTASKWTEATTAELCQARNTKYKVLQIVKAAESTSDNLDLEVLKAGKGLPSTIDRPVISTYNYGRMGRQSQYLNQILASVLPQGPSPVDVVPRHASMPSITAQQATQALFASFMLDPLRFHIFGANVSYSLSPAMHNAAYQACGMPHLYTAHSISSLDSAQPFFRAPNFGGAAVTQPFKIEILSKLDSLSIHAKAIRAVNTLVPIRQRQAPSNMDIVNSRNRAGPVISLHGDNTDWIGIRACIRRGLSPINTVRPSSCGLVVGAGGMARAAIYAMIHLGVHNVFIYNRTTETAKTLADYYNELRELRYGMNGSQVANGNGTIEANYMVRVIDNLKDAWPSGFRPPTMIVCGVPAQTPDGETATNFTIPEAWLHSPSGGVVVELAYRPLVTPLVRQIRAEAHRGWIVLHGLDMLPEQAFAQFELFTGRRAPRRLMREQVLERFREEQKSAGGDVLPGS